MIEHIAYQGSGPSVIDLVSGEVQMMIGGEFLELAKSGQVRILATTNAQRWTSLPDVPTLQESGLPSFAAPPLWFGLMAPVGTPDDIVKKLNEAIAEIQGDASIVEQLAAQGSDVKAVTPDEFAAQIADEQALYREIAEEGGSVAN